MRVFLWSRPLRYIRYFKRVMSILGFDATMKAMQLVRV